MFAIRGIIFTYEAVREWEAKLTPALAEELRAAVAKRGAAGTSTKLTSRFMGAGAICIAPLGAPARWST
jgi:hypothetical protein